MENLTDVQYLIKFVSKKEHAESLCHGNLFMHSAEYYHQFKEQGQGDKGEASIFSGVCIYCGGKYPIYCMAAVTSADIIDGSILINKRMVRDFKCQDGFVVLINFKLFQNRLKYLDTYGNPYHQGLVQYGIPSLELSKKWFSKNSLNHLFVKRPFFSYQKEYRIIVLDPLFPRMEKEVHDGMDMNVAYYDTSRTYHITKGLQDISQIYPINLLRYDDDVYYIDL